MPELVVSLSPKGREMSSSGSSDFLLYNLGGRYAILPRQTMEETVTLLGSFWSPHTPGDKGLGNSTSWRVPSTFQEGQRDSWGFYIARTKTIQSMD